jgi:hypothetical protein
MRATVRRLALAAAVLGPMAGSTQAGTTFFTGRASYNAATTGNTTINFEGIAPPNDSIFEPTPPGITLSGVNFTIDHTNNNSSLFVIGDGFYYAGTSVLSSQFSDTGPDNIVVTLPRASTAFAVDFGTFNQSPVTFTLSTGETFTQPTPAFPGLVFLGVVDTTPFTSVRLSQPIGDALNLADVTFGTSAVPEPSALAMGSLAALTGLGLGWWRRDQARRR